MERNVKFERGIPLLGTFYRDMLGWESEADNIRQIYNRFPNERFFGVYDLLGRPSYVIRDPELIKQVSITHFEHFRNHRFQFDEEVDPMGGRNLFIMRDEKWRRMRATMSPAFTGNKMRLMHRLIVDYTTKVFINDLKECVKTKNTNGVFDTKDLMRYYATDIIATCAFGIEINSLHEPNNEFFRHGREITNTDGWQGWKFLGAMTAPWLMKFFQITLFPKESTNFFRTVILNNIQQRLENKIVRNDMIDLLIKAKAGQLNDNEEGDDGTATSARNDGKLESECGVFYSSENYHDALIT